MVLVLSYCDLLSHAGVSGHDHAVLRKTSLRRFLVRNARLDESERFKALPMPYRLKYIHFLTLHIYRLFGWLILTSSTADGWVTARVNLPVFIFLRILQFLSTQLSIFSPCIIKTAPCKIMLGQESL